jgi:hypothetical protein
VVAGSGPGHPLFPVSLYWALGHWGVLPALSNTSLSCRDGFLGELVRSAATERMVVLGRHQPGPFWRESECLQVLTLVLLNAAPDWLPFPGKRWIVRYELAVRKKLC